MIRRALTRALDIAASLAGVADWSGEDVDTLRADCDAWQRRCEEAQRLADRWSGIAYRRMLDAEKAQREHEATRATVRAWLRDRENKAAWSAMLAAVGHTDDPRCERGEASPVERVLPNTGASIPRTPWYVGDIVRDSAPNGWGPLRLLGAWDFDGPDVVCAERIRDGSRVTVGLFALCAYRLATVAEIAEARTVRARNVVESSEPER